MKSKDYHYGIQQYTKDKNTNKYRKPAEINNSNKSTDSRSNSIYMLYLEAKQYIEFILFYFIISFYVYYLFKNC